MKAQLSVAPQVNLLTTKAVTPGVPRGEEGDAVKAAVTTRPTAEPQAMARMKASAKQSEPAEAPANASASSKTRLRFDVDEPSGRMVVSIVDKDTSEVVRQIPAEEMLAIARQIEERLRDSGDLQGLFVADKA